MEQWIGWLVGAISAGGLAGKVWHDYRKDKSKTARAENTDQRIADEENFIKSQYQELIKQLTEQLAKVRTLLEEEQQESLKMERRMIAFEKHKIECDAHVALLERRIQALERP